MTTQPVDPPQQQAVPHTIGGISEALRGSRRAQFFAEVLAAEQGEPLEAVMNAWWARAVLDSDPDRARIHAAAENGTLPTTTFDDIRRRRTEADTQ